MHSLSSGWVLQGIHIPPSSGPTDVLSVDASTCVSLANGLPGIMNNKSINKPLCYTKAIIYSNVKII